MPHASLADRRKALGLTQYDLAIKLGVAQTTVSRCENADKADRRYALALEALELRDAAARRATTPSTAVRA